MTVEWGQISAVVGILSLLGVKEWRDSAKRNRVFDRLDAVKKDLNMKLEICVDKMEQRLREDYMHKDVLEVHHKHMTDTVSNLKDDLEEVKAETKLIPAIKASVEAITKTLEILSGRQSQ